MTVLEDDLRRPILQETVLVHAPRSLPLLYASRAMYGHVYDPKIAFDVSSIINNRISSLGGHQLFIDDCEDLNQLFGDPCHGVRKKLWVSIIVRGFVGLMKVEDVDGHPQASIQIGYHIYDDGEEEEEEDGKEEKKS